MVSADEAAHLGAVYDAAVCGLLTIDRTGAIIDANDAARALLGLPHGPVPPGAAPPGSPDAAPWELRTPEGLPLPREAWPGMRALATGRPQRVELAQLVGPGMEPSWVQIGAAPVAGPGFQAPGSATLAVVSVVDVTARVRAERRLAHQTSHDALTDLPNRAAFLGRLDRAFANATPDRWPLSLLLLDLDRFRDVNDALGHGQGDLLLRRVAERLRAAVPDPGVVAHLGGDEFAVLLPGSDEGRAAHAARALLRTLAAPLEIDGERVDVGASIGVSVAARGDIADGPALLRRAAAATKAAKRKRGGVTVYDPTRERGGVRVHDADSSALGLLADLRQALAAGHLELHYQPVVDAATNRAIGVEALVRWPHPKRGMVPPDRFIPLAEQSDLITPLTGWVLETALRQERLWREDGLDLRVAVNLSMRTLHNPRLPATIADLLRRHAVAPDRLTLEVTESGLMDDPERAEAALGHLRTLGVRTAIDDFGTGYSSLAYLKRLPVDIVKIDRSFVRDMGSDEQTGSARDAALVCSIIGMAHALGLSVVAEGVETAEAWQILRSVGCEEGQGYYLGKAMRAGNMEHWLRAAPWTVA